VEPGARLKNRWNVTVLQLGAEIDLKKMLAKSKEANLSTGG